MLLTCKAKLNCSDEQLSDIQATLAACNAAANVASSIANDTKTYSRFSLHKKAYKQLRAQFGLSAQTAVRVIGKVADAYKKKKTKHQFKKLGAVPFDSRNLTFHEDHITIRLLAGRVKIPMSLGEYQKYLLQFPKGEADLFVKNGEAYLSVSVEVPEAELRESSQFIGVDMGIVNLAVDSLGNVYSGKPIDKTRERVARLRAGLQSTGTKSAKRHLKKLGNYESRFRRHVNHVISKELVKLANDTQSGIALEALRKIEKKVKRAQRARHNGWAFYQLRAFIEYKAKRSGTNVVFVNPAYTSQMCSACGYVDKNNRKGQSGFLCVLCGHKENADLNAAKNIASRALVNMPIVADRTCESKLDPVAMPPALCRR